MLMQLGNVASQYQDGMSQADYLLLGALIGKYGPLVRVDIPSAVGDEKYAVLHSVLSKAKQGKGIIPAKF